MRKVDQLEDAVDQSEAKRQEGVHRAQAQPVDHLLEQHAVVGHYFRLLWLHPEDQTKSPWPALARPSTPCIYPARYVAKTWGAGTSPATGSTKCTYTSHISPGHELCGATPRYLY